MILICSHCSIRYLVPATAFTAGPRQVRCARCGHSWLADLPQEVSAALTVAGTSTHSPTSFTEPPFVTVPIPEGSNLPALWKDPKWHKAKLGIIIGLSLIGVCLLSWLILDRQAIAFRLPIMERIYNAVGLTISHVEGGLSLQQVRSEQKYDSGAMRLVIDGEIHNDDQSPKKVPDIQASAIGPDGKVMQSWRIPAPVATLKPGAKEPFQSVIDTPEGTVVEINLSFTELSHDNE